MTHPKRAHQLSLTSLIDTFCVSLFVFSTLDIVVFPSLSSFDPSTTLAIFHFVRCDAFQYQLVKRAKTESVFTTSQLQCLRSAFSRNGYISRPKQARRALLEASQVYEAMQCIHKNPELPNLPPNPFASLIISFLFPSSIILPPTLISLSLSHPCGSSLSSLPFFFPFEC